MKSTPALLGWAPQGQNKHGTRRSANGSFSRDLASKALFYEPIRADMISVASQHRKWTFAREVAVAEDMATWMCDPDSDAIRENPRKTTPIVVPPSNLRIPAHPNYAPEAQPVEPQSRHATDCSAHPWLRDIFNGLVSH